MNDANDRHTSSLGIDLDLYINVSLVSTFTDRLKFRLCKDEWSILYWQILKVSILMAQISTH
jgi:hypothetical protein